MAFALWTRSDVVVLTGAFILFSIWIFFKEKKWLPLVLSSLPLISFLVWSVFSKQHIPRAATSFFIKDIFFDVDKLSQVLKTAWEISTSSNTYGLTFSLFFLYLVIHIAIMIFTKTWDNIELLFILLVSWGGYTLLYYQMDNSDGTLFSNGGWMLSGYKRGLFVYAPIALFFVATSYYVKLVFEKLDSALQLFKSKL
jgi:signal transduction histidine kinase